MSDLHSETREGSDMLKMSDNEQQSQSGLGPSSPEGSQRSPFPLVHVAAEVAGGRCLRYASCRTEYWEGGGWLGQGPG